ncbi:MAG TPA: hypothetical protein VFE70_06630 [Candidatus Elarobacter sp.]|nr:hypothetical protein [Candidatus Elarobacter sp.]
MSSSVRAFAAGLGVAALTVSLAAPLPAQTPAPAPDDTRPFCVHGLVAVDETIDSSHAHSGDVFRFQVVDAMTAPDGIAIPAGTTGYGLVANAAHAERGGRGGYLALEARFVVLPDGKHVQAIIDRVHDELSTAAGGSANAPGLLGLIPIVGYAVGGYDSLHHGKDATIPSGTRIGIFLGDDAALGTCQAPTPSPAPKPS